MSVDTERRSGTDRRKQTGISMHTFAGNGARITIRRQEDRDRIFSVAQFRPVLFLTIVAILFLCVIDAILTLYLFNHGAYETPPIMTLLLNQGPWAFFVFKNALTIIATFCLLMFRCVLVKKINVSTHAILFHLAWVYAAVVGWELYSVYHVV
jgi:hypothetical protein